MPVPDSKAPSSASTNPHGGARNGAWIGPDFIALAVLILVLGVWAFHVRAGWKHETLTGHEFRQAQTALTIQAVGRDGFRLDYSTPVLGKPWSIPMEFPLYQWTTAAWSDLSGMGTAQAGRAVSIFAFLAGLPAVLLILRSAGFSWGAGFWNLAVLVATPVYAYYSAAVLIESTAWCASAWFLWGVLTYRKTERAAHLLLTFGFGFLAVLVKPTTWAVACLPWAALWLGDAWKARQTGRWRPLLLQAGVLGIALLVVGFAWVSYADHVKARNPIAHFLLSTELRGFNFGTWGMKVAETTWSTLAGHWLRDIAVWPVLVGGLLGSLIWSPSRRIAVLGVLAFGGIQLIFTNLYVAHDYYLYANAGYLVVAVCSGLALWWDRAGSVWRSKVPAGVVLVVMLGSQLHLFRTELFQQILDRPAHAPKLATLIRDITNPDDVVVGHVGEWNSWLAYHSERRMLMIPDSQMFFNPDLVNESIQLLDDESVPLMLVHGEASRQSRWISQRIEQLELHPVPLLVWNDDLTVFARFDRYGELQAMLTDVELVEVKIPDQVGIARPEDVAPLEPDVQTQIAEAVHATPLAGDFPHGLIFAEMDGKQHFLVHAPTHLVFAIPAGAEAVDISYLMPPNVFAERDFDGLMVVVESWDSPSGRHTVLARDWVSAEGRAEVRDRTLDLRETGGDRLLIRVEPGPFDNSAFDQAWLESVQFRPHADRQDSTQPET